MDSYESYRRARNEAWRILLKAEVTRLPIDPEALAPALGAAVLSRRDALTLPRLARVLEKAPQGVCVSLHLEGKWHIVLRDGLDAARRRFAAAHELGHIVLGSPTRMLTPGVRVFRSAPAIGDLMDGTEGTPDYGADIFAIRLLSPACILHELRIDTPGGIAGLCGLPPRAAAFRAERMALLNARNAFYTHSLERQVRDRFLPAIRRELSLPDLPSSTRRIPAALPRPAQAPFRKKGRLLYCFAALLAALAAGAAAYFLLR